MAVFRVFLLALTFGCVAAARLRHMSPSDEARNMTLPVAKLTNASVSKKAVPKTVPTKSTPTNAEVQKLRTKLEGVASRLDVMVEGNLASMQVGPALKLFVKKLKSVLKETASEKDPVLAMKKLDDAKAGIGGLTSELTNRQESLMKEDESQSESLLLGVLMTRQKETMAKQLEVLKSDDFKRLEVSKTLLAAHNDTTPLFSQAADFLDKNRGASPALKALNTIEGISSFLDKRVKSLEGEFEFRQSSRATRVKKLEQLMVKSSKRDQATIKAVLRREGRKFKKWFAVRKHDIESMKAAVVAVRKGDMKALERAQAALQQSLKAMESKSGSFLHLLQLGHTVMQRDCPFCVAQCVGTCHNRGESYVQCLVECQDAGNSK